MIAATIFIAAAFLIWPVTASGSTPQISVLPRQPVPGQRVTVRGSGFCDAPCSAVKIRVDGSVVAGNVAVAADGTFSVGVGLTPVAGTSTIVASQTDGAGATRAATAIVHIVAADQTPAPLPTPTVAPPAPTKTPVPSAPSPLASPSAPTTQQPPQSTPPSASPPTGTESSTLPSDVVSTDSSATPGSIPTAAGQQGPTGALAGLILVGGAALAALAVAARMVQKRRRGHR